MDVFGPQIEEGMDQAFQAAPGAPEEAAAMGLDFGAGAILARDPAGIDSTLARHGRSAVHRVIQLVVIVSGQGRSVNLWRHESEIGHPFLSGDGQFPLIGKGRTAGVFQLEGNGMTRYILQMKPQNLNNIIAMVALFRPGPMDFIPKDPNLMIWS